MIGVDVIKFTIEKTYDCCIVVTGDVDLLSAMKFAESKGGDIKSAFLRSGYSSELRQKFKDNHLIIEKGDILTNCLKEKEELEKLEK